jgi:hypothetical protein
MNEIYTVNDDSLNFKDAGYGGQLMMQLLNKNT